MFKMHTLGLVQKCVRTAFPTHSISGHSQYRPSLRFGFDSATKIDPDWKHKSHNTNVRLNVVFHCVQRDLTVHWQRLQGATSFFSDQTHFLIMRIKMLFFFNVVNRKVNFSSMFSRHLAIWSHHNNKLSAKSFPFCVTVSVLTLQIPICSNSHLFAKNLQVCFWADSHLFEFPFVRERTVSQ